MKKRNKVLSWVLLLSFFIVLASCSLFKKKCDCPTWSKVKTENSINKEQKA